MPLAVAVDGANRHDMKLVETTLSRVQVVPDDPEEEQNLCLDKGYDYPAVDDLARDYGHCPHIRSRGEEKHELETIPGYRARRWVVERTHSWMNRFRRLLIRASTTHGEKEEQLFEHDLFVMCVYHFSCSGSFRIGSKCR